MKGSPFRFIQISDIHHFADSNQILLGVNTHDSFSEITKMAKKDSAELVLLTGDLAQDETEKAYIHIANEMKSFPVPVYWIPGNHDDLQMMSQVYPRENISNLKHIVLDHWHIILLNSQKPGAVKGYLDPTQLHFMQHCLDMFPEHYALIACHHNPLPVGCAWLDKIGLSNAEDLWTILARYPRVKAILSGHVHQQHEDEKKGIRYFSTPSTCIQFKKNSQLFALEKIPPGYRWLELYPDGELKTEVCRLEHYVGMFDEHAKGY
jgi:3',5'-cyclic-AMP phosphodiesterase